MKALELIELKFDGNESLTISSDSASKIPVLRLLIENTESKIFFIDRSLDLFNAVWTYTEHDHYPEKKEEKWELEHYGISLNSTLDEQVEKKSQALIDQIQEHPPFHVSAGGRKFITTKERLRKIGFFNGAFNEHVQFKALYSGTEDDPYHSDVPGFIFADIITYLREPRNGLSKIAWKVIESLGGFTEEDLKEKKVLKKERVLEHPNMDELTIASKHVAQKNSGGALMSLVAIGAEDMYLTCNSQISFFKQAYQRHTNYSFSRSQIEFQGESARRQLTISRQGDVCSRAYIEFEFRDEKSGLPKSSASFLESDDRLPFKLIRSIELEIGGQRLEHMEGFQLFQRSTVEPHSVQSLLKGTMCVNIPMSVFQSAAASLPLIALQYHDVKLNLEIAEEFIPLGLKVRANLVLLYFFLDSNERAKFAQNSHEYLLQRLHYHTIVETQKNVRYERVNVELEAAQELRKQQDAEAKNKIEQYKDMTKEEQLQARFGITMDELSDGHARARDGRIYYTHRETGEEYMWYMVGLWFHTTAENEEDESGEEQNDGDEESGELQNDDDQDESGGEEGGEIQNENSDDIEVAMEKDDKSVSKYRTDKIQISSDPGTSTFIVRLHYKHPCSVLFFSLHLDKSLEESFYPIDDLIHFKISLNGHVRDEGNRDHCMRLNKLDCGMAVNLAVPVYAYSFSLNPFDKAQPHGSTNFSKIDKTEVVLVTSSRVECVRFWGLYNNVLRVMSGMAGLGFN